ncbi:putative type VI secretion system effector [Stenotrophomonas sp. MMGLT7]|uniref:putative type VI secretion system effector n=1 Tax=Stenotrophomonas sp. MMGLT7 TaxID=2901227 RepID=UPI001E3F2DAE|nr:putative type VI secretion system effector [Stenotrophomonas sp. MMGLT7]MCD7099542.1 hypothetical protein [Stenotrophomonas sp. MMGLT7]
MQSQKPEIRVLSGTIRNLKLENTTAEVFFRTGDRESMAATGALAAAMGLGSMAAGMAAMSTEETREPVTKVSFDLDGEYVEALLWNWPFKEGDAVQVVAEASLKGSTGFAVLDPANKIIALYPHVSSGSKAHWRNVVALSMGMAAAIGLLILIMFLCFYVFGDDIGLDAILKGGGGTILGVFLMFAWLGYRIGRRFLPFVNMAEQIFTTLGWKDVGNINLRKITKAKRKPNDPPAMGDSYFRY